MQGRPSDQCYVFSGELTLRWYARWTSSRKGTGGSHDSELRDSPDLVIDHHRDRVYESQIVQGFAIIHHSEFHFLLNT